ncbi:MAG: hypothetical protein IKG52_15580 [Rhodobacteraceae bacterium]|nr:hypothetical protein [Paracoccaceae bacterium]
MTYGLWSCIALIVVIMPCNLAACFGGVPRFCPDCARILARGSLRVESWQFGHHIAA